AYNTGVGWRQIIENMHKTANLAEWYKEHGRHAVYAKGKAVPLTTTKHSLSLPVVSVTNGASQTQSGDGGGCGSCGGGSALDQASPYLLEEEEAAIVS
ncbi:MAG: hypothetical protein H0V27_01895, partial [Pyrinomonadaceae bacterium]|nr:hypothetical protein [Pyrinomonadaceae bacterium]